MKNTISMNDKFYTFFFFFFLIIYYLYMMTINTLFAKGGFVGIVVNLSVLAGLASIISQFPRSFFSRFHYLYIWLVFILILVFINSSDFITSIRYWILIASSVLCFVCSYYMISSFEKFKKFLKVCIVLLMLYIFNFAIANIFNLGDFYGYRNEEFSIGNIFAAGLYTNTYVIILLPLLITIFPKYKTYIIFLCVLIFAFNIVNLKRTVILSMLVGFITIILLIKKQSIKRLLRGFDIRKYVVGFLVALVLISPLFYNVFLSQLTQREDRFSNDYNVSKEGRITEFIAIVDETINNENILKVLFGHETFNAVGNYAGGKYGKRGIHNDYAMLIHGTGILGLAAFILFQSLIFYEIINRRRKLSILGVNSSMIELLFAIYTSYWVINLINMFSGVLPMFLCNAVYYSILGMILRYCDNKIIGIGV